MRRKKVSPEIRKATEAILKLRRQKLADTRSRKREAGGPAQHRRSGSDAEAEYTRLIANLKSRIRSGRVFAAQAINREMLLIHWDVGRALVVKQAEMGWDDSFVRKMSCDLSHAFPGIANLSPEGLLRMREFYLAYASPDDWRHARVKTRAGRVPLASGELKGHNAPEIIRELVTEIPWSHHLLILDTVTSPSARVYYLQSASSFGWSREDLTTQIQSGAYERSLAQETAHVFRTPLPEYIAKQAEATLHADGNLEFLGTKRVLQDREWHDRCMETIERWLLGLDTGFCLARRSFALPAELRQSNCDLLFYQRHLRALLPITVRRERLSQKTVRDWQRTVETCDASGREDGERSSIGVLVCIHDDAADVRFGVNSPETGFHADSEPPEDCRPRIPPGAAWKRVAADAPAPAATNPEG